MEFRYFDEAEFIAVATVSLVGTFYTLVLSLAEHIKSFRNFINP